MSVKTLAAQEQMTCWAWLDRAWRRVFKTPCASNMIVVDAKKCEGNPTHMPYYAKRYIEMNKPAPVLSARTARLHSMLGLTREQCHLVADPAALLMAHKDRDGVWRC